MNEYDYLKCFKQYSELSKPYFDALCKLHAVAIPKGVTISGFIYDDKTEELKTQLENAINEIHKTCFNTEVKEVKDEADSRL